MKLTNIHKTVLLAALTAHDKAEGNTLTKIVVEELKSSLGLESEPIKKTRKPKKPKAEKVEKPKAEKAKTEKVEKPKSSSKPSNPFV